MGGEKPKIVAWKKSLKSTLRRRPLRKESEGGEKEGPS